MMQIPSRNSSTAVLTLVLFSIIPAFAKETPEQTVGRKAITSIYARVDKDAHKRDVAFMAASTATDFKYHRRNGQILNRGEFFAPQKGALATMENVVMVTTVQKIEWRGTDAVVWVDATTRYKQQGASIVSRGKWRDFWSKTKKGWTIRQSVELMKSTTLNGVAVKEQP